MAERCVLHFHVIREAILSSTRPSYKETVDFLPTLRPYQPHRQPSISIMICSQTEILPQMEIPRFCLGPWVPLLPRGAVNREGSGVPG